MKRFPILSLMCHIFVFLTAQVTRMHVPRSHRNKLAAESKKAIFVGYTGGGKSYRLWHPGSKKISVFSNVHIFQTATDTQFNVVT